MKIGISAFAADGGKSGISQYMINVLQRLPRLDTNVHCVIFVPAADRSLFEPAPSGSEISTSAEQPRNAPDPIKATEPGIVMAVALEQPSKAYWPMEVTDPGIVMVVALEQPLKA